MYAISIDSILFLLVLFFFFYAFCVDKALTLNLQYGQFTAKQITAGSNSSRLLFCKTKAVWFTVSVIDSSEIALPETDSAYELAGVYVTLSTESDYVI